MSVALKNLPSVRLDAKPRMADFASWIVAAEPALPWKPGAFMGAYIGNRGAANELAIDASIIAGPVASLLTAEGGDWQGTARDLLDALESGHADEKSRKRREWPATPRKLSGELRRLAPNLRRVGIDVTFSREAGGQRPRLVRLERTCKAPSLSSRPSRTPENAEETAGRSRDGRDGTPSHIVPHRPYETPTFSEVRDDRDDRDGVLHVHSNGRENGGEVPDYVKERR